MSKTTPKGGNQTRYNWEEIRQQWEAGAPVRKIAALHGCASSGIYLKINNEGWNPGSRVKADRLRKAVQLGIAGIDVEAVESPNVGVREGEGIKSIGKGRSVGQPMGEIHADQEVLSKFGATTGLRAPEADAVFLQAATEIELMARHRKTISRAAMAAENILTRLHALVVEGHASDVITFQTKKGEAYHRVAFLGDRESVSDALLKCTNTIAKLIPLERQAHGLQDKNEDDHITRVTLNMPNVKVVSVDGKGKIVSSYERPAPIDVTPESSTNH
jgi:hypothetical protein